MPYKPGKAPQIEQDVLEKLAQSTTDFALFVEEELEAIATTLQGDEEFTINYSVPERPRKGLFVYADGVMWNPGNGAGFYFYNGTSWIPAFTTYTLPTEPAFTSVTFTPQTAAPSAVEGKIAYADGSGWNPTGGEGLYVYKNGAWTKLDPAAGPNVVILTAASGTYNVSAGCTRLRVRGVGGGGGSGTTAGGAQTAGGSTTFSGSTMSATGGAKGTGAGGGAAAGGTGTNGQINYQGGDGQGCVTQTAGGQFFPPVPGGGTFLHPFGGRAGLAGSANTGAGGGASAFAGAGSSMGCGGGGGGFERWINSPAASYTYTVGAGGSAGTSGFAGAAGVIVVEEFFD